MMRIYSIPPKELLNNYSNVRQRVTLEKASGPVDKAELTSEGLTFSAAFKAAKAAEEVSSATSQSRIEAISQKIAEGTYSVSGEDVARKLLGL